MYGHLKSVSTRAFAFYHLFVCSLYIAKFDINVTYVMSRSNVLYDVELCCHGVTLEDMRFFFL